MKSICTPYWRTLKTGGEVNPKYPGGVPVQKMFLEAEGHRVTTRGKKTRVEYYETKLVRRKKSI
jgi:alkylated DNA nucleotide flippase Atl1